MTFYQELQLSSTGSKQLIKNTTDKKEKRRHILIYNFKVYLVMIFLVLNKPYHDYQKQQNLIYYRHKDNHLLLFQLDLTMQLYYNYSTKTFYQIKNLHSLNLYECYY